MRTRLALVVLAALPAPALGQWSADSAANQVLAGAAHEEAQPKVLATPDGGCYVSWFDSDPAGSPAFGYDVRLQRYDRFGQAAWPAGGVLVADRGFSSTQDYGLAVDAAGDAYLAFRDDRLGGVQVTATRVTAAGAQPWGATGVPLTNTTQFLAAPKIAATSDGAVVVAWTQDAATRAQRLAAADGAAQWPADVEFTTSGTYTASDLRASDAGSVIVSLVRGGGFTTPRHLHAQKLDAAGAPLWGASPLVVFDGGSLQFGNFPTFVTDGLGGAVFSWYSSSPSLECFVQRVVTTGFELYPHDGVAVSTDASQLRVSPDAAFDPATQSITVAYTELNGSQSDSGVSAQRVDAAGNRLWGATGASLVPLTHFLDANNVRVAPLPGAGARVAWASAPGGQDVLTAVDLDAGGAPTAAAYPISSTPSPAKYRLAAATTALGETLLVWQDDTDLQGQNVRTDGTLGLPLRTDAAGVSLAAGGSVGLDLNANAPLGGSVYLLLGSATGTAGLPVDGWLLPLTPDAYTNFALARANTALYPGFLGVLSGEGTAGAALAVPAASPASLAGVTLHHAFLTLDLATFPGTAVASFTSNAVATQLLP